MSYHSFIGIDIGKFEVVVADLAGKQTQTFSNDEAGWSTLFRTNYAILKNAFVVLETTGGYEAGLLNFLIERTIAVHRADTRKVKSFIRSFGQRAKTDAIDAAALAQYGKERHAKLKLFTPQNTNQIRLKILEERRQDLKQMLVTEKNRHKAPLNTPVLESIRSTISFLEHQIELITEQITMLIEQLPELKARRDLLQTIPGIGPITSSSLIALIPELGHLDNKQIASLCGVAPHLKQSGTKTWYARTTGGRRNLRPILYMAAMAARKTKTPLGEFYERLVGSGKKKMVALVALMRKIVVIANAKSRDALCTDLEITKPTIFLKAAKT